MFFSKLLFSEACYSIASHENHSFTFNDLDSIACRPQLSGMDGKISAVDDSITVTQSLLEMCLATNMDVTVNMSHNIKKIENNFGVGQFAFYRLENFWVT